MKKNTGISGNSCIRKARTNAFLTDGVLIDVYNTLTRDFQRLRNVGKLPFISSVREYRDIKLPPLSDILPIDAYKSIYQLKSFFSRYTASDDVYSQKDRMEMSQQKYEENLIHINTVKDLSKPYLQPVIGQARKIIREILGPLQVEEVFDAARFGRRASIGVPFRESYLENKMVPTMSLSKGGATVFRDYVEKDAVMASYLAYLARQHISRGTRAKIAQVEKIRPTRLRLSFVAKKFDKLRGIMPYPTGDTLICLGIGDTMVSKLKEAGLDLARLQAVHRGLVKSMSLHRRSVTMDLSGASDSITRWLVRLLLPSSWWNLLKKFYFKQVILPNGSVVHTETFSGMGCGFTFPLETLVFYALLKSIGSLVPVTGHISVYGDDCIFPTTMMPYVERVFDGLGLKINREKTFVTRFFRESCGEDCYKGTPVRPFQPEGATVELSGSNGSAYLYKILNGLLHRWKHREIPNTVEFLLRKIALHSGSVLLVPPFQPDTAGYKVSDPDEYILWYIPCERPVWHYPKGTKGLPVWLKKKPSFLEPLYMYKALRFRSNRRFVRQVYPYLWETLRSSRNAEVVSWDPYKDTRDDPSILGYALTEHGYTSPYVAEKGPGSHIEQAIASSWDEQSSE